MWHCFTNLLAHQMLGLELKLAALVMILWDHFRYQSSVSYKADEAKTQDYFLNKYTYHKLKELTRQFSSFILFMFNFPEISGLKRLRQNSSKAVTISIFTVLGGLGLN